MAYNGYTNHETWLVDLWMEKPLRKLIQEDEECNGRAMHDLVYDFIEMENGKLIGVNYMTYTQRITQHD